MGEWEGNIFERLLVRLCDLEAPLVLEYTG